MINNHTTVILRRDRLLTALDNKTGQIKWEYDIGKNIGVPWSMFLFDLDEERLVVSVNNAELLALDMESGFEVWRVRLTSPTKTTPNVTIVGIWLW